MKKKEAAKGKRLQMTAESGGTHDINIKQSQPDNAIHQRKEMSSCPVKSFKNSSLDDNISHNNNERDINPSFGSGSDRGSSPQKIGTNAILNTPATTRHYDGKVSISTSQSGQQCEVDSPLEKSGTPPSESSPKKKKKKKKKKKNDKMENSNGIANPNVDEPPSKPTPKASQRDKSTQHKMSNGQSTNPTNQSDTSTCTPARTSPKLQISLPKPSQMSTLQKAFLERLTSSRFRELNEELYTQSSQLSYEQFTKHPELFDQYHVGFRKQVLEWPLNPVDVIYKKITSSWKEDTNDVGQERKSTVVADFGCGDAKLAERLLALRIGKDGQSLVQLSGKKSSNGKESSCPFKVHSFDLVSGGNPLVTPADMSNVPLPNETVDVAVYSLALMGTNVADFVREAWRVLKFNGVLRVAEVRSRFETAASGGDEDGGGGGGGKRGKLNNGKKYLIKNEHHSQRNAPDSESSTPKPLILLDEFMSLMERCGFKCNNMDRSNKMFLFMDFVKVDGSKGLSEKETFTAKPCIYKRR